MPGGSGRVIVRAARRCKPLYDRIWASVANSDWVAPDETGWPVGGLPARLHTLAPNGKSAIFHEGWQATSAGKTATKLNAKRLST
jgi:hypothetical protein